MSNILTGFNMQGNDPIDNRIVSPSKFETLEEYLQRVPIQKRYYGLSFYALDEDNKLRHYTFQTSLIEPTIDDDEEEIERLDKELQEHVNNKEIHKTSEEIRSEIVDADIPDTMARVQWTLDQIDKAIIELIGGASDEYNTLKKIQDKIVELRCVNKQDIVDNLNTDDPTKVLSARQGKVLSKTLTNYFDSAMASIRAETNRATNAENRIEAKLDSEIDRSTAEDIRIQSELDAEEARAQSEEKRIEDKLDAEIERSTTKDTELGNQIIAETNRAEGEEQRIETKLDNEIKRSTDEDLRIDSKLDAEIERSTNEDIRIDNKLDSEINRSTAEDDRLDQKIDAETTRATTAESNLNTKIETETDRAEGEESRIETKLDNEITRSTNKDTEHDNRLQALEGQTHEQNTDLGTTNSTFQLKYNTGNKIKHESDAISVRNAADTDYVNFIAKNATFKGDLLVEGQSFVTEAETVEIKDNILLLNKGEIGSGVTKGIAGLEIDRGTEPNYFIVFDESDNRFKAGVEGDLWNLALRESDDNMLDGYFISWNSKDKILSTTNIVNESTPLLFGRTDYKKYSGDKTYQEGVYSSYSFIDETPSGFLYNSAGDNNWNIDTSKLNFRFWKPILGITFKRTSDNSEVLYHADIINDLTTGGTSKVLSAEQGKLLQNSITNIQGSYLPLSGGNMKGNIVFNNNLLLNWKDTKGSIYQVLSMKSNDEINIGNASFPLNLYSKEDLFHKRNSESAYKIWDAYNLPTPASTTDLANYLPLAGGTLTGQLTIKQSVDIKLRLQSTDADNYCIIQAINSQASQLGVFGYAGNKWAIGHGGTYYEIWDKYNLTNPVTYIADENNYATLKNKDGQYFTYIKAGTNGLLPHSKATLVSGGSGFLGTSNQSFNAGYINHLYTNKLSFGVNGPYIIGDTSVTQFLDVNGGVQKVATGGLYVGVSYASDALNLVPAKGIYSHGNIRTSGWLTFEDNEWADTGWTYKDAKGSIKVLFVTNEAKNKPTSYGSVLQFNSRQGHWCTQIWCDQTNVAGVIGTLRFRTTKSFASTEWNPWTSLVTEFDLNSYLTKTEASTLYLPLSGGTMSGNISFNGDTGHIVVGARETSNFVSAVSFNKGSATNSANIGYHSTGGSDSSGALVLVPYSTSADPWAKTVGLYIAKNELLLDGKAIATQEYVTWNNVAGKPTIYERTIGINGTYWSFYAPTDATSAMIYGPTSAGTSGQILQSTGGVPKWVNASSVVGNFVSKSGDTMTGALTMKSRSNNIVVDVVGGAGDYWEEGAGALSIQVPNDSGQTPLILARRSGAAINTTVATERLLSMELLDTGHTFIIGMSGSEALQLDWTSGEAGTGKLFGKQIATTDQIPSIPSISISNSGSGNVVTGISASGHTLTVTKGSASVSVSWDDITGKPSSFPPSAHTHEYIVGKYTGSGGVIAPGSIGTNKLQCNMMYVNAESSGGGYCDWILMNAHSWSDVPYATAIGVVKAATPSAYIMSGPNSTDKSTWVRKKLATTDEIPTRTSDLTNNSGFLTSSSLSGYATQSWANGRFLPLSGGKLTGDLRFQEANGIILRSSNNSYISGIFADTEGNECVAVWAKNTATRLRWHAGIDMSEGTANLMMGITPDFEITKASGTAIGKIAGNEILHSNNYTSYTVTKTGDGASGTWGINVSGNAATATNSTQLGGTAASSYVKANDNISRLTNDRNYVRSTSTLKVADIQVLDGDTPGSEAGILYIVLE